MSRFSSRGFAPPPADDAAGSGGQDVALRLDVEPVEPVVPFEQSALGAVRSGSRTILVRRAHGLAQRLSEPENADLPSASRSVVSTRVAPSVSIPSVPSAASSASTAPAPSGRTAMDRALLEEALVVPAGTLLQGRICTHALLLHGEIVGSVHCGRGPAVILPGASIKGPLVSGGDVHVYGSVIDYAGGTVVTTPGTLVLAPGARVEGDVCSGRLEIHEGARLNGAARGFQQ